MSEERQKELPIIAAQAITAAVYSGESAGLVELVKDLISQRDEARRELVAITAIARDGHDDDYSRRIVAADYGWSYLFEETP